MGMKDEPKARFQTRAVEIVSGLKEKLERFPPNKEERTKRLEEVWPSR